MTACPECGKEYQQLGKHATGDCNLSIPDMELFDALLVGDGTLDNGGSGNYRLTVSTVKEEYARHLEDLLSWMHLSTRVSEFDDRQDLYIVRTIAIPEITEQYERWYPNGEKRIPDDFNITPTTLKHWYAADGHLKTENPNPRVSIGSAKEMDRSAEIEEIFPFPVSYVGYEICFRTKDTEKVLSYMGDPPPGFEYKWEV